MRHYDQQVVEAEENRRARLHGAVFFGPDRWRRRWPRTLRPLVIGLFLAALIAAGCVAASFIVNLMDQQRARQEQLRQGTAAVLVLAPDQHPGAPAWPSR